MLSTNDTTTVFRVIHFPYQLCIPVAFYDKYKQQTGKTFNGFPEEDSLNPDSPRRDPVVIAILESLGVGIVIKEIPTLFEGFVSVESGYVRDEYSTSDDYYEEFNYHYDDLLLSLIDKYVTNQEEPNRNDFQLLCEFIKKHKTQNAEPSLLTKLNLSRR
jgi:hypothetical protein